MPFVDELLFMHYRVGRLWTRWALGRAISEFAILPWCRL